MQGYLDRNLPWQALQGVPERLIPATYDHDLPDRPAPPVVVKLFAESPGSLLHWTHPLSTSHQ